MTDQDKTIQQIARKDPRYARECYHFVGEALAYTIQNFREQRRDAGNDVDEEASEEHHVTGQDLLNGIRELAAERFGPLAPVVFRQWGVRETLDFGRVVFNLIDVELMSKQETDSLDDFADGFDFDEAFTGELDVEIQD